MTIGGCKLQPIQWYPDHIDATKHDAFTVEGKFTCMLFGTVTPRSYPNFPVSHKQQLPDSLSFFILEQVESDPSHLAGVRYRRIGYLKVFRPADIEFLLQNLSEADISLI